MASFFQNFNNSYTKGTVYSKAPALSHLNASNGAPATAVVSNILRQYAEATLGSGSLQTAVLLPEGEDAHEWAAVHVVDFFNQINILYGTITEFCSPHSCPRMLATEDYEYLWQDCTDPRYHRPTTMPAPEYIDCLLAWAQRYIDDEALFPTQTGISFSNNSLPVFKTMLKRLFRVYAHIYCHHFNLVTELGLQPHLNTSLKHFVLFTTQFDLVDHCEFAPLKELITILLNDH